MNLFNIFSEIEKVDADVHEKVSFYSRRQLLRMGSKAAMAGAIPAAVAASVNTAYAQSSTVADVLNFALTLEYLEAEFYNISLSDTYPTLLQGNIRIVIDQIRNHENAHVVLLRGALGAAAVPKPTFDFTAGGMFPTVFTSLTTFLTVAQAFEDTGVRAYKGQAGFLLGTDALTTALQIHAVEARHASEVRRIVGELTGTGQRGWVRGLEGFPAAVYAGEDNLIQGPVSLAGLSTLPNSISAETRTEAFDEPLTKDQVLAIAGPFIKK